MTDINATALAAIIASYRSLADQLETLLPEAGESPLPATGVAPAGGRRAVFDPEVDTPPVAPDPNGGREQADWCGYLFFGRLRAINVRQGRGADAGERTAIARAAGYADARAFAGWTWTWKDLPDGRWITDDDDLTDEDRAKGRGSGMGFLRHYAKTLDVRLPEDLA